MLPIFQRSRRNVSLLSLLLLSMLAAPASAGVFEGNGEIGFDVGWMDLDDRGHHGDENRVTFRGGYHFNDLFQLEGQLIGGGTGGPEGTEVLGGIFANAVFNWHPAEAVVPYALVGVGAVEMESFAFFHCHGHPCHLGDHGRHGGHGYHDDHEASGAVQVGIGSRFFFGLSRTAARVEASLMAFEDDFGRDQELFSLTVGLTWRLGRRRPPAVTAVGGTD